MRLIEVVLLVICLYNGGCRAQDSDESEEIEAMPCPGGFCVEKHLCVNGSIVTGGEGVMDERFGSDKRIPVKLQVEVDECELYSMECCSLETSKTKKEAPQSCPGGFCVQKHLCVNGLIVTEGEGLIDERFGSDEPIPVKLRVDDDECEHYLMKCCSLETSETKIEVPQEDTSVEIPEQPNCGVGSKKGYIYHLDEPSVAQYGEFPWMVALLHNTEVLDEKKQVYFCGGSLIHPQVVLTAAHCLKNRNVPQDLIARLGEWDTASEKEPFKHQNFNVKEIYIHDSFNPKNDHNDIALLILEKPAKLSAHINTICLPAEDESVEGLRCAAAGWGKKEFHAEGEYAKVMKKVELPIVPRETCIKQLRKTKLGMFFKLHSSFMCAGGEKDVDACRGDGGGPLVCTRESGEYVQAGIVSWGIGCGQEDVPGVYVDVTGFIDWIENHLPGEESE